MKIKYLISLCILVLVIGCDKEEPMPTFDECKYETNEIEIYDLIDYYNYSCPKIREIIMIEYVPYNLKMTLWNISYKDKEKCGEDWISIETWNLNKIREYYFEECLEYSQN